MSCERPQTCGHRAHCACVAERVRLFGCGDRGHGRVAAAVVVAAAVAHGLLPAVIVGTR